jgi:hypothetical protein
MALIGVGMAGLAWWPAWEVEMDPVTLIVCALAAGTVLGLKDDIQRNAFSVSNR